LCSLACGERHSVQQNGRSGVIQTEGVTLTQKQYLVLYRSERADLEQLARKHTNDYHTAEDIVADAFIALWRKIERGEDIENAAGLLRTTVVSRARDHHRNHRREVLAGGFEELAAVADYAATTPSPTDDYDDLQFRGAFDNAVRAMEEDTRDPFILTELRGLTVREAGTILDVDPATVSRRAEAARTHVRRELP